MTRFSLVSPMEIDGGDGRSLDWDWHSSRDLPLLHEASPGRAAREGAAQVAQAAAAASRSVRCGRPAMGSFPGALSPGSSE